MKHEGKMYQTTRFIEKRGIAIYFLGIKKDKRGNFHGYNQEML